MEERHRSAKRLGQNLARLRRKAGFTQEELAEKADISPRYVQALEVGRYVPTIFIADALRQAVHATWAEFLDLSEREPDVKTKRKKLELEEGDGV